MVEESAKPRLSRRYLRFGLRAVFVVLTLVAVAGWWWQKRFRVETTESRQWATFQGVETIVESRKTESKRRRGLDTVLDGPTNVFNAEGVLISEENWRDGIRHGMFRQWDDNGELLFECEFDRDRPIRVGDMLVKDFMPSGATVEGMGGLKLLSALRKDTTFAYTNNKLKDVLEDISFQHNIPVMLDVRMLDAAGIDSQMLISAQANEVPLYVALTEMLAPLKLTSVVRYDVLWITTPDSILLDDDLAPRVVTADASPQLLEALAKEATFDYLEQSLGAVLQDIAFMHGMKIETKLKAPTTSTTLHYRGSTLKSGLGVLIYLQGLRCQAQGDKLVVTDAENDMLQSSHASSIRSESD